MSDSFADMKNSKSEILNTKQISNFQITKFKRYDLEERTYFFARRVNEYVRQLPRTISNVENGKQLVRSSGSVGANYIEANESLSRKDFKMRIKICKKETKESRYWLKLTWPLEKAQQENEALIIEATE